MRWGHILIAVAITTASGHAAPERITIVATEHQWTKSMTLLREQIGVIERGSNDGTMVRRYLASVGLRAGNPWCWALQYWSYAECDDSVPAALKATGSTQTAWYHARRHAMAITVAAAPQAGDLVIYYTPGRWSGHGARITDIVGGGWLKTIEGNTSSGGQGSQRDGDGCYARRRNWLHPMLRLRVRGFIGRADG